MAIILLFISLAIDAASPSSLQNSSIYWYNDFVALIILSIKLELTKFILFNTHKRVIREKPKAALGWYPLGILTTGTLYFNDSISKFPPVEIEITFFDFETAKSKHDNVSSVFPEYELKINKVFSFVQFGIE